MGRTAFEVLVLGSASATPTGERHPSAQLVNVCERYFLVDCGEATQIQLRRYHTRFQRIGHIFISHLHGDHFFGLPGLLSTMQLLGRRQELTIWCPGGLIPVMDQMRKISDTRFSFPIHWKATSDDGVHQLFGDDKVEVFSFPLKHRISCCGFLFREKPLPRKINKEKLKTLGISVADIHRLRAGLDVTNQYGETVANREATFDPPPARAFAYCSDTAFDPAVAGYVRGVDLLYHESTFLEEHRERAEKTFHSTARQAAEIARMAGARRLLLGHFSARYATLDAFAAEAGEVFSECLLATDGKKVEV